MMTIETVNSSKAGVTDAERALCGDRGDDDGDTSSMSPSAAATTCVLPVARTLARSTSASMVASSWDGSWWNRTVRRTPAAHATSTTYSIGLCPHPTRAEYSEASYCAS